MLNETKFQFRIIDKRPQVFCSFDTLYATEDCISLGCQCDCTCGTPLILVQTPSPSLHASSRSTLCAHPELRRIPLTEEYKVAFVPSKSKLVVVNSIADALLDVLAQPRSIDFVRSLGCNEAISRLIEAGLLVGAMPESKQDQTKELAVWLHVTNECNLHCSYCYLDKTSETMPLELGLIAIDAACRSAVLHGFHRIKLKLAGGEPTLVMPLVLKLHDYAKMKTTETGLDLQAVVLSNGVQLTRDMAERLLGRKMRLMISMDGVGSPHDEQRSFPGGKPSSSLVIEGIERAISMGLTPEISVTMTAHNAPHLRPFLEWILERGIPFHLNFYRENGHSAACYAALRLKEEMVLSGLIEAYTAIAERFPTRSLLGCLLDHTNMYVPHRYTCGAGHNYLVIDHHGHIAKCQMDIGRSVTTIWDPDPLLDIRQDKLGLQNPAVEKREGCFDCEWRYWCAGGCPLETYRATGRYDVQSPKCHIYRQLIPEVIKLEGQRILALQESYNEHNACRGEDL